MILKEEVLFSSRSRLPGTYISPSTVIPSLATYATVIATNRPNWQRPGASGNILALTIEASIDFLNWNVLAACTADTTPSYGRDGQLQDASILRCRLPRTRGTGLELRTTLEYIHPCQGGIAVSFDDMPIPPQRFAEHSSVTYDNDNEVTGWGVTSVTIGSFAVGNNANRCMLVGVGAYDSNTSESLVSTINHNGSTAGWVSVIEHLDSFNERASIWRKVAPDIVTSTVVVTMGGTCAELGAHALSVWDVDQTTPTAGEIGADGETNPPDPITLDVSAATGDLVYDVVYNYGVDLSYILAAGASQTERANALIHDYTGARTRFAASTEPGGATVTMSWAPVDAGTDTLNWSQAACAIKVATAAGGHPTLRRLGGIAYGPRHNMRGVY